MLTMTKYRSWFPCSTNNKNRFIAQTSRKAIILLTLLLGSLVSYASTEPAVIGRTEYIQLVEPDITLLGKIDTGAYYTSLNALDIKIFNKDDEEWVAFTIPATKLSPEQKLEYKLHQHHRIVSRASNIDSKETQYYERPVVLLTLCLAERCEAVEVNLTDRSHFTYPLLVGRDTLRKFNVLITPDKEFLYTQKPKPKSEE